MEKDSLIYKDELTGVGNRRLLNRIKKNSIKSILQEHGTFTVVMTDIDHFKEINDTYGHIKGDTIIKEFSGFLKENLRKNDIIIRYGGDEFLIIQPGMKKEDAILIWQRLVDNLKKTKLDGLNVSMSVGVASYPEDSTVFEELIRKADSGLYEAKRSGRGRVGVEKGKTLTIPPHKFINRQEEKELIGFHLQKGSAIVILGEAGIGKTRLIRESLSHFKGIEILWSDCISFSRKISYYPLRELVKYKMERSGKEFIKSIPLPYKVEIGKIVPQILEDVSPEDIDRVGEVLDRYRLYEGFLQTLSFGDRNKVIVIDNIQWIDEDSVEALKYIVRRGNNKINFIFASRTEEVNEGAKDLIAEISRFREVKELRLKPLSENHVNAMIEAILGESNEEISQYVFEKSGGNAFYIEEMIKTLYDNDYLILINNQWKFKEPESDLFSKSIEDIIENKLKSISPEGVEVLKISSVLGYIDFEFIKEITGYNEGHIIGLLEEAVEKGLLKETEEEIKFKGQVIREIIYNRKIGSLRRKHLHKLSGQFLERSYPEKIEEIAYHYKLAGVNTKIIEYSIKAAEKSEKIYANEEAIKYYTWAIEALLSQRERNLEETRQLIKTLQKKAKILNITGAREDAAREVEKALSLAEEITDKVEIVKCLNMLSTIHWGMNQNEKSIEEAQKALQLARVLNDQSLIAESAKNIGDVYDNIGEYEKALQYYNDALSIFRRLNDKKSQSAIWNNIGVVYEHLGDYKKAISAYEEALKLSKETDDLVGEGVALVNMGISYKYLGDYSTALSCYTRALEISLKIGLKVAEGRSYNNIGVIYGQTGNYEKALEYFKKELQISESIGDRMGEDIALSNIGMLYEMIGEFKKALQYHEKALKASIDSEDKIGMEISYRNIGVIYFKLGNIQKAKEYINMSLELAKNLGDKSNIALCINDLGILSFAQGDLNSAIEKFKTALSIREDIEERPSVTESHLALFEVYIELGKQKEAAYHIDAAVKISKELGKSPLWINTLNHKAIWHIIKQDIDNAEKTIKKIMELKDIMSRELLGDFYSVMGIFYSKKGEKETSRSYFEKAIEIYRTLPHMFKLARTLSKLAHTSNEKDRTSSQFINEALSIFHKFEASYWIEKTQKFNNT